MTWIFLLPLMIPSVCRCIFIIQIIQMIDLLLDHHRITSSPGKAPAISSKFLRMKLSLWKIDSDYTTQHHYEWNFYKFLWGCSLPVPILPLWQRGSWTDVYPHSKYTMVWPCILTKLCDVWGTWASKYPMWLVRVYSIKLCRWYADVNTTTMY